MKGLAAAPDLRRRWIFAAPGVSPIYVPQVPLGSKVIIHLRHLAQGCNIKHEFNCVQIRIIKIAMFTTNLFRLHFIL